MSTKDIHQMKIRFVLVFIVLTIVNLTIYHPIHRMLMTGATFFFAHMAYKNVGFRFGYILAILTGIYHYILI